MLRALHPHRHSWHKDETFPTLLELPGKGLSHPSQKPAAQESCQAQLTALGNAGRQLLTDDPLKRAQEIVPKGRL